MEQNIFHRFLTSKLFPYIAGGLILLLIILTIVSYTANRIPQGGGGGLGRLFQLSDFFGPKTDQVGDLQQTIEDQRVVSEEFANFENKVAERYPWKKKLPLTSDKYFIFFDLNRKSFVGRLYPDNDDLIEQLKAEAIRILKKEKGVPLESFQLDWDVYPKNNL